MKKLFYLISFLLLTEGVCAQIEITLRTSFIDSIKNRATVHANFFVDKAHKTANPAAKDGDMHIAGRDAAIGLPIVAEIMNAGLPQQKNATTLIHGKETSGQPTDMTGVWRIWCEHSGSDEQVQGEHIDKITTTNPPHVFEIHPVLKADNIDLLKSLKPIEGFTYKNASEAFAKYEGTSFEIIPHDNTITMLTKGVGYNYVKFKIEILSEQAHTDDDSRMFFCSVLDNNNDVIVQKVRMIFIKESSAEKRIRNLQPGDRMRVVGIPRIDLALVSYRARHSSDKPFMLKWNLPYEMVIVAALN